MTGAAQRFIQPLTFSAITHAPVHTDPFAAWHDDFTGHVGLGKKGRPFGRSAGNSRVYRQTCARSRRRLAGSDCPLDCRAQSSLLRRWKSACSTIHPRQRTWRHSLSAA